MAIDLRDYFQLRCSEMLVMERDIWQMNNLMSRECQNRRIKESFERHNEPTRQQISNLEQIVDRLGGMTGPDENPVTQGMMRAHRLFMEMNPPQELIDVNDALEGEKTEHLEMASYTGLITLAQQLDEDEIVQMLQQNFQSEKKMCGLLEDETPVLFSQQNEEKRKAA